MSGAPIMIGTIQLPKPPIIAGMTMKNTMIRPCPVMRTLKKWLFGTHPWRPGACSSSRNHTERIVPMIPATTAKIRYIVPMSLWLVE